MTVMMESGCFLPALAKYKQALSILEDGLLASTKSEQREINVNRAKCLMNLAASSMAIQNYGDAVRKRDFGLSVQKLALDFIYKYHKHFIFDIKCITV